MIVEMMTAQIVMIVVKVYAHVAQPTWPVSSLKLPKYIQRLFLGLDGTSSITINSLF